jgi:aldehyde dehydrogenase (NAD+)
MYKNYINGEFTSSGTSGYFHKIDPSTEEVLEVVNNTVIDGVDLSVAAARNAFHKWSKISRPARGEYFLKLAARIERRKDDIIKVICAETGKNKNEALAEVNEAKHMCEITAGRGRLPAGELIPSEVAEKSISIIRKPRGVVACVTPWNFPYAITHWTSAPAILEGNCVVHKPSQLSPLSANLTAELYHEAGFPAGVYNMIQGQDEAGKLLVENSDVNYVLFTGSAEVGMKIKQHCATQWNKDCSCEMGSKSAVIVMDDGNLDLALDACVNSSFKLAGQRCVSAGRILVHRQLLNSFVLHFIARVKELVIGAPSNEKSFFGPVISKESLERVVSYNEMVLKDRSCRVLIQGDKLVGNGYFLSPFVYLCEWANKRFLKEEVFGPHVAIIPFDDADDAIRIYNDTDFGLSCAVITDNFRTMKKFQDEIDSGMIYFNAGSIGAESSVPFGGIKKSGIGHPSASGNFDATCHKIAVTTNYDDKITWAQGLSSNV